ncbi:MAG: hypothetical protein KA354_19310 [Phycisphaerae bacterium]|nr:hypothetical protein [Phycisphaerae bacterium]
MSSRKQIGANRRNARSSTGPHDTGQTSQNAVKHGLLAKRITDQDQSAYAEVLGHMLEHYRPVGPLERWLVEQISLLMVRIKRAAEIEKDCMAQLIRDRVEMLEDLRTYTDSCGLPRFVRTPIEDELTTEHIRTLNESVGRYETALENKLYRELHELERLQRQRQGESVPAPAAGDLNIHGPSADPTQA